LREIVGYEEDRSSAETLDSQGKFKQQHDTGQNLKYVIVYPRLILSDTEQETPTEKSTEKPQADPEQLIIMCEYSTFIEIINSKTHSWKQRKKALHIIQEAYNRFKEVEEKLMRGAPLAPEEEFIYNSNSGDFDNKISFLQDCIKKMIDEGKLTVSEKADFLASISKNIEVCQLNLQTQENATQKNVLEKKLKNLLDKKQTIEKIIPVRYRLQNGPKIVELRKKLMALEALEDKRRSMSLTLTDLKSLEEKPDLEAAIGDLERAGRGWFLDDLDFQEMCNIEKEEAIRSYKASLKTSSSNNSESKSKSKTAQNNQKPKSAGFVKTIGSGHATTKSSQLVKKTGFAAAFGDRDSDSD
jgi:polyhydroxyalkanoate synthesis regulator phasin